MDQFNGAYERSMRGWPVGIDAIFNPPVTEIGPRGYDPLAERRDALIALAEAANGKRLDSGVAEGKPLHEPVQPDVARRLLEEAEARVYGVGVPAGAVAMGDVEIQTRSNAA